MRTRLRQRKGPELELWGSVGGAEGMLGVPLTESTIDHFRTSKTPHIMKQASQKIWAIIRGLDIWGRDVCSISDGEGVQGFRIRSRGLVRGLP